MTCFITKYHNSNVKIESRIFLFNIYQYKSVRTCLDEGWLKTFIPRNEGSTLKWVEISTVTTHISKTRTLNLKKKKNLNPRSQWWDENVLPLAAEEGNKITLGLANAWARSQGSLQNQNYVKNIFVWTNKPAVRKIFSSVSNMKFVSGIYNPGMT